MTVATVSIDTDELARLVQTELSSMDGVIRAAVPSTQVSQSSNSARAWAMFCYRVYATAPGTDIDPVVVGVNVSHADATGAISVSGDIAGETLGDVLTDVPPIRAMSGLAVEEAAREVVAKLKAHTAEVIRAITDETRRA